MFNFIEKQILGMQWLSVLIEKLLNMLGINMQTKIGESIHFFIYDTLKIMFLLCVIVFIMSYIQSYFPPERTKKILGGFKGIFANTISAILGTVTPFCSCSSIPIFIGFTNAGLSTGVTFSFLISSPLVDIGSIILLASIFGFKIAITYVIVGIILAVIGGTIIEKFKLDKYIKKDILNNNCGCGCKKEEILTYTKKERIINAKKETIATFKSVYLYILVGVLVGAFIHNWIPEDIIQKILGQENIFSVIIATIVGIPMYASTFGTLPIAEALYNKGVGIGTVLAFIMSITALSLPSMIMLKRVLKNKLLFIFISITSIGIILIGYLFNIFEKFLV